MSVGVVVGDAKPQIIGWREWVSLPELHIRRLKAKIDTGARTSAIHASEVECYQEHGINKVRFIIHPRKRYPEQTVICVAELHDIRWVTDSGGHREQRPVIMTPICLSNQQWLIEVTLTSRDDMSFRMLLGRTAMQHRFIVNPAASYLQSKCRLKL